MKWLRGYDWVFLWYRLKDRWETDIWGWLWNVPISDPAGGHCYGRRTGKPVYCPDCDGEKC